MRLSPTVWFKLPWELLYTHSGTPETLKAVQVALVKPVAYLLSYRQVNAAYKKAVFWSGAYFVASCGGITVEQLKAYVEQQDSPVD